MSEFKTKTSRTATKLISKTGKNPNLCIDATWKQQKRCKIDWLHWIYWPLETITLHIEWTLRRKKTTTKRIHILTKINFRSNIRWTFSTQTQDIPKSTTKSLTTIWLPFFILSYLRTKVTRKKNFTFLSHFHRKLQKEKKKQTNCDCQRNIWNEPRSNCTRKNKFSENQKTDHKKTNYLKRSDSFFLRRRKSEKKTNKQKLNENVAVRSNFAVFLVQFNFPSSKVI